MGGRGASSGISKFGNPYGSQYHAVLTVGNIKFVQKNSPGSETLMETMTPGRVYVLVDAANKLKSIVYFDTDNKRAKQIDLAYHHGKSPHVHRGYLHNEYSPNGDATGLLPKERNMVERVVKIWDNHKRK